MPIHSVLSYSISPPIVHFFVIICSSWCQKATCMAKSFQVLQNDEKKVHEFDNNKNPSLNF